MRVVFPYFAQLHQVPHSLPIAAEMALRHPDVEVHVATASLAHRKFIDGMLHEHAANAPLHIDALLQPWQWPWPLQDWLGVKKRTMIKNRDYLRSFDAIVVPERTSLFMRQLGLGNTRLIWTRHGAGDRAVGFADDIDQFDFVLLAGRKIEQRLLDKRLIRPGKYLSGVYPKFDWLHNERTQKKLFNNNLPTVLYNPHFNESLSSWEKFGLKILDIFAKNDRYNLIFAPHVRLFDPPTKKKYQLFETYHGLSHLHIDLGSVRSIDMTYVQQADLYLGDVSSQVAEFVIRPRPCLFINAHGANWRGNQDYEFWNMGPVVDGLDGFYEKIASTYSDHSAYVEAQRHYLKETFGITPGESSAARGADAIVKYLRDSCRSE